MVTIVNRSSPILDAQAQEDILDDEALLRELDLPTPSNYHDDPEESPVTGMSEQATLVGYNLWV